MSGLRCLGGVAVAAGLTAASVLSAAPAAARVTAVSEATAEGGPPTWSLLVSNERENVTTTKIEVTLPAEPLLPDVIVPAKEGWASSVVRTPADGATPERVSAVVWTADTEAARIAPGQTVTFPLVLPGLSATVPLVLAAAQTYADGAVDSWPDITASQPAAELSPPPSPVGAEATPAVPAPVTTEIDAEAVKAETSAEDVAAAAADDEQERNAARGLALGVGLVLLATVVTAISRRGPRGTSEG